MNNSRALAPLLLLPVLLAHARCVAVTSQCYGRVANGRIENSVKLPASGPNFTAYSAWGSAAGRTHVHSTTAEIMLAAYRALEAGSPQVRYVYGETGWPAGGRFRPHQTHQNGLSVDFFVPVRDQTGKSVALPTGLTTKMGYAIEFDADGRYGAYRIDFPAIAEHLYQLDVAAKAHHAGIAMVIFDTAYLPRLFVTPRGQYLQQHLSFMKGKPWVRHDEHYHVDFAVPCKP
ncbi:penicillin-insensitive murein endopeptidase [Massilia sp. R2A-15]|uniref:penicillin-insensitive murein endopeptidase n=1 Tax=Massilia sp. R2A-15 TaxID=3064278 RepID=UPI002732DB4D|nr:penicillin-insensitive murein endopeptidase [Massilia sp. R2A-15]WLI89944.1 penicillin-insensitive murein endopeptidase [Massilia sp. R2A-15]